MTAQALKISPILDRATSDSGGSNYYTICWIHNGVKYIEINQKKFHHVSNSLFIITPDVEWTIYKTKSESSSGYLMYLPRHVMNHPTFKNYKISKIHLIKLYEDIPKINLSPRIEKRVQVIFEMIDELISINIKHKDEAVLSLLNTFFVYCDGECNIKSSISDSNSKGKLVYNFKKNIDLQFYKIHDVGSYAQQLNVTDKYLNECVRDVLGRTAKSLINEQIIIRARHALKFTDLSVKEVGYQLGFSSPDYFTYFIKKHTGISPSQHRKS